MWLTCACFVLLYIRIETVVARLKWGLNKTIYEGTQRVLTPVPGSTQTRFEWYYHHNYYVCTLEAYKHVRIMVNYRKQIKRGERILVHQVLYSLKY